MYKEQENSHLEWPDHTSTLGLCRVPGMTLEEGRGWEGRKEENGPRECCLQPRVTWTKALSGQTWLAAASLGMPFPYFPTSCKPRCSPGPRAFQSELKTRQLKPCSRASTLSAGSGSEPGLGSSLLCTGR